MVTEIISNPGKILDLFALRKIEANCLCLRTGKRSEYHYKAVVEINSVNFSLMSEGEQESILAGFRIFLSRLSTHQSTMIHIRIEPYKLESYLHQIETALTDRAPIIREMAQDHEDFVLKLASQRALLQRRFYIVVSADQEKGRGLDRAEVFDRAKSILELRCNDILQDMDRCGLTGHRLENTELKCYYQSCLHYTQENEIPVPESNILATERPIRPERRGSLLPARRELQAYRELQTANNQETPVPTKKRDQKQAKKDKALPDNINISELLAPSCVELDRNYVRIHHHTDEYVRGLTVIGYPATVFAGWLDRLIQIDEPLIEIVLYIEPLDSTAYTAKLSRKLTGFRATQLLDERHGRTSDPYIKAARQDVEDLREQLVTQQEKVFGTSLYLIVRATNKTQLKERTTKLLSLLKSLEITATDCAYEHHKAWLCGLPDARDILKRRKILDTSTLVTAFPFASSSLSTSTGMLVGVMPNGSLVIIDPKSELLENGHEVKFARSGAGKSYDEKIRIARALISGYECIVIDPEDEYLPLCKKFDGTSILLSSGALQLNPFDLPSTSDRGERNILEEKFQSLHTLFDLLLADKDPGTLSQREKGFLNKCFITAYTEKGITSDTTTHTKNPPCMRDLYEILRRDDPFELADRLQRYVDAFPQETTIGLNNRLVVFHIRDLNDDLKPVGLFLITDFVWTQVRREKHPRPRLLCIDEAWTLMAFTEGGRFLAGLSRRARKYNLFLRTITQDVEDFLNSEWGRTILVNSSIKFLMKQDATTIDSVTKAFHLSDGERKYLLGCQKGQGLFFARSSHVPLQVVASSVEHKIATTNPQELLQEEIDEAVEQERLQQRQANEAIAVESYGSHYNVVLPQFYVTNSERVAAEEIENG